MQGFSGKILPAGLEIFPENRRLDLAFPSNPGITFAPRTEMTAWCGVTERRENGGKRKWRQIRQENFKGEIREKKKPKRKRNIAGNMKPANHLQGSMVYLSGQTCRGGQIKSFFPVCLLWVTGCSIYGQAVIHGFPLPAQRNSEKEKSSEKP